MKLETKRYYNAISKGYKELYGEEQRQKWKVIEKKFELSSKDVVLDAGCGDGAITQAISKRARLVVGIDLSKEMLRRARQEKNCFYVNADLENLPFKDKTFDKVISLTVLQDLEDPKRAIEELGRVCKGEKVITCVAKSKLIETLPTLLEQSGLIVLRRIPEEKDIIYILDLR
jgi:ubiquinone/menaquinone biosynthesis C-methylase UbiE